MNDVINDIWGKPAFLASFIGLYILLGSHKLRKQKIDFTITEWFGTKDIWCHDYQITRETIYALSTNS